MEQLDKSQRAFCEAPVGNIRLLAPAGCGKTLCLLFRCKHLAETIDQSVRFLIVTFTRAAQQELSTRLNEDSRFSDFRNNTEIITLNSWGFRRIKNATDYPKLITSRTDFHFAVLNQLQPVWQKHERIKNAIQNSNRWRRANAPRNIMNVIDAFKSLGFDHIRHSSYKRFSQHWNALEEQGLGWRLQEQCDELSKFEVLDSENGATYWQLPGLIASLDQQDGIEPKVNEAIEKFSQEWKREVHDVFFSFWREATAQLIANSTFTLEDQKYYAYQDELKNIEQGRLLSGAASYNHIFVDEFQDINPLDLALIKTIAQRNRATITIAGDDDQAIFEWRGATPEYILDPTSFFDADFKTYTLGVNYRSPANIVSHSQRLIAHNERRVDKQIKASGSQNADIEVRETDKLMDSLAYVHRIVSAGIQQGISPSRVAIIGRKRSQIIPYQVYFASKEVPFCAAEDLQVFLSGAFERLLDLLNIKGQSSGRRGTRQVVNDLVSLCDFVKRYPLNKADKQGLESYLRQARPRTLVSAIDALKKYRGNLKGNNPEGNMSIAMATGIREFIDAEDVSDALVALSEHFEGLHFDFGKAEEDVFYTDPPFDQLAEYAASYGDDYDSFIDDIELAKDTLVHMPPFEEGAVGDLWEHPLHLMTALRAKGKEFDTVILLDVNDGIWPNQNAQTPSQLESERRVFYVAFTRAKERVVMLLKNKIGNRVGVISPYIEELGLST